MNFVDSRGVQGEKRKPFLFSLKAKSMIDLEITFGWRHLTNPLLVRVWSVFKTKICHYPDAENLNTPGSCLSCFKNDGKNQ